MGTLDFVTQITKQVNLLKTVNLQVDKDVFTDVDLTGDLATAEASADALGDHALAETDTFAQISGSGAFSFSESLAATSGGITNRPGIDIEKATNGEDADTPTGPEIPVGDTATFSYVVTNTGNAPIGDVVVTDDQGVTVTFDGGDDNGDGLLDLDETWTYSAGTTVTLGQYANIGTVTGTATDGTVVTNSDPSHHFGMTPIQPGIDIEKATNGEDADTPTGPEIPVGDTATFSYVVTNTGNAPIGDVVVTDDQGVTVTFDGGDDNGDGLLDLDETWTYSAGTTVTLGQYANIGTVTGTATDGTVVTNSDPSHHFGMTPIQPGIDIEKATNGEDADTPTGPEIPVGDTATFSYVVTNTGNAPIGDVVVTDDQGVTVTFDGGDDNGDGLLDLDETWTYSAGTTVTLGQYANIGTVTGTATDGTVVTNSDPSHHFGMTPIQPGIDIEKATNGEDADTPTGPEIPVGDTATFSYVVTNTGNAPIGDVVVTDDQGVTVTFDGGDDNGDGLLDLDETWTYSAGTTVTLGQYANIGTVTGTATDGTVVTNSDPSHHFGMTPIQPGIDIEKATNGEDADTPTGPEIPVGDTATFSYVVTNTGNAPIGDVVVTDDQGVTVTFDGGDDNGDGLLDLDETWTYSAGTTVTLGQYANIGTVTGTATDGTVVTNSDPSHHFGMTPIQPGIDIEKATNGEDADTPTGPEIPVGDTATFSYVVTNTGNAPIGDVVVTDDQGVTVTFDGGDDNGDGLLDLDETWTYSAGTTVTLGQYANIGTVTGTATDGTVVTNSDPSHHFGMTPIQPGIDIEKATNGEDADTPTGPEIPVGDTATFSYVVTNTGNAPIGDVVVTDDQGVTVTFDGGDTNGNDLLDPGEAWLYSANTTVTPGQYANVGTVTATATDGTDVTDSDPSHHFGVEPGVGIIWQNGGEVVIGEADAKSTFNVGTNSAVPTEGNFWVDSALTRDWSNGGNWSERTPPTADQEAIFTEVDAGRTNFVDQDFTIASLHYSAAGDHTTDFNDGSILQVNGETSIGSANPQGRATLVVTDRTVVTGHLSEVNVGVNATGSGAVTGNLELGDAAVLDLGDVDQVSIGLETQAFSSGRPSADGSLILGSNSTMTVGSEADPANLTVGWNQTFSSTVGLVTDATGTFDALEANADVALHLNEFTVGRHSGNFGTATGTLRWNQPDEAIHAADVYFGRGGGATGVLDVPAGGTLNLGSVSAPVSTLRIAFHDNGRQALAAANLDLRINDPDFTAFIADELSIGRKGSAAVGGAEADGSLILGSNSTITVGSEADPANLTVGWNQTFSPTVGVVTDATGTFDAAEGTANLHLNELNVGHHTGNFGTASGEFVMGDGMEVHVNTINIGMGLNATGRLNVLADVLGFIGVDTNLNLGTAIIEMQSDGSLSLGSPLNPLSNFRIGYNINSRSTAETNLDFNSNSHNFSAFVADELLIGLKTSSPVNNARAEGSLILGSNSTITVGSEADPANLTVGWNQTFSSTVGLVTDATGTFDALEANADVALHLNEFTVGRHSGNFGTATGTLRWNQPDEAIHAADVYFGRGGGATGVLDVPAGGTLNLGSVSAPVSTLRIAFHDNGRQALAAANLDLRINDPDFTAFIADELSIGRKGSAAVGGAEADGSLILGSNSTITVGSEADPANLTVGWNQTFSPTVGVVTDATGTFDAAEGTANLHLNELNIGHRTGNFGTASGEFVMGNGADVDAATANIGVGSGATGTLTFVDTFSGSFQADTVNFNAGLFDFGNNTLMIGDTGNIVVTTFNFSGGVLTGGTLDVDSATGALNWTGGTLCVETYEGNGDPLAQVAGILNPGCVDEAGETTVQGDYDLSTGGTLQADLLGTAAGTFDTLAVNGEVDFNADGSGGGALDVLLGFLPSVSDSFVIVENDGNENVVGVFEGKAQGAEFDVAFDANTVTMEIDYLGGDGNDVELRVTDVLIV